MSTKRLLGSCFGFIFQRNLGVPAPTSVDRWHGSYGRGGGGQGGLLRKISSHVTRSVIETGTKYMNPPLIYAAFGAQMTADLRESANRMAA